MMIQVENLTKKFKVFDRADGLRGALKNLFFREYRDVLAVNNISFSVPKGEISGFIGPNGAGKSTTIKMLTGILAPTEGSVRVAGLDPYKDRIKYVQSIGVVFGQRTQLWWDIAVIESLRLLKRIYEVSDGDFETRLNKFRSVFDIDPLLKQPVRKLSLGERMRCDLAASLIHNPPMLYLDEPTIGLDVIAKGEVRRFLKEINREYGTTVLLTTHDLQDIEELSNRLVVIDKGKVIFDGIIENLKNLMGLDVRIEVSLSKPFEGEIIQIDPRIQLIPIADRRVDLSFKQNEISPTDAVKRILEKLEVKEFKICEPQIEDVIRKVYLTERSFTNV